MKPELRVEEPQVLMPKLLALLEAAESVPLVISGNSMSPFLTHRRDTVYLSRVQRPLKKGDMILFRRDSGDYILHRILRMENGMYILIGDAQNWVEPVRDDQVLALVTAVRRKDKLLKEGDFWWFFFEKIWIRMIPLRCPVMKLYALVVRK